jgi:hypothetical protein
MRVSVIAHPLAEADIERLAQAILSAVAATGA